ncbi:hypothetical protein [Planktothrix mougeotii]|uniref:Uncharacterized protein n=1 Tax=Planktothrix mougeotii LEGE 06226 TaxID=1828728 RepID=A0ABR9UEM5_9CYAN|nr:hypothetical protein [Planktothrix mougeotii]MBE9144922.1 hypothetical protein [Planktothrix mougeotii LEGE 06226]
MARLIPESKFNRLQEITHQLQALTDEQSEAGQLVDELDRILLDSDIEQTYSDVAIEKGTHKLKPITGAYIV